MGALSPGPLAVFAAVVAQRFYGLDGACVAAGCVWLLSAVWGAIIDRRNQQRVARVEALVQITQDHVAAMQTDLEKVSRAVTNRVF